MKNIVGNDIDVVGGVFVKNFVGNILLDRRDVVVEVDFCAAHVPRKAPHLIVHEHDVGIEAVDEEIQGAQGRNHAAGRNVDVDPKGGNTRIGVGFGIGVGRDMAFVKMRDGPVFVNGRMPFVDEHGHRGPAGIVVLARHIDDVGFDDFSHFFKNGAQFLGIVDFIDIFKIIVLGGL